LQAQASSASPKSRQTLICPLLHIGFGWQKTVRRPVVCASARMPDRKAVAAIIPMVIKRFIAWRSS
jgi:hypothetical protein